MGDRPYFRGSNEREARAMIQSPSWLYFPYIANILILVPVCGSLVLGGSSDSVFQGKVTESDGLRLLVASLYLAILCASVGGLFYPHFFAPIILVQILYKTFWLMLFIAPLVMKGQEIPEGISIAFAAIIITYPVCLWLAMR